MAAKRRQRPLLERFWAKVSKHGPVLVEELGPCWVWRAATNRPGGYGVIRRGVRGEGLLKAHRVAYEAEYGELDPGVLVRHRCDNPPCVRPSHLLAGSHAENARDAVERGRSGLVQYAREPEEYEDAFGDLLEG